MIKAPKFPFFKKELSLFNFSGLISTSLGAWLGGAGLMLYHFYTITPLNPLWTVIASPFITALSILGYTKLLIGLVLPAASRILDILIKPIADLLIWLVKLFAEVNLSEILFGRIPLSIAILYYCTLFFGAFFLFRRPLLKKIIACILILTLAFSLFSLKFQRAYHSNLILSCIDVGHGQAIVAQMPGGKNLLFDAGSLFKTDPGRRIIIPFLRFQAIDSLDAIIISHNDIDHINAVPELVSDMKVNGVFVNDDFSIDTDKSGTPEFLVSCLKDLGCDIQNFDNLKITSPDELKIIWPPKNDPCLIQLRDNDRSAVFLITYAGIKILFCSDIEKIAQHKILEIYPSLNADIVIVPHHGSTVTTDPAFLKKLQPNFLICSSAQLQQKPFVSSAVSFFTARDGLIQFRINKTGTITTDTFLKQKAASND